MRLRCQRDIAQWARLFAYWVRRIAGLASKGQADASPAVLSRTSLDETLTSVLISNILSQIEESLKLSPLSMPIFDESLPAMRQTSAS